MLINTLPWPFDSGQPRPWTEANWIPLRAGVDPIPLGAVADWIPQRAVAVRITLRAVTDRIPLASEAVRIPLRTEGLRIPERAKADRIQLATVGAVGARAQLRNYRRSVSFGALRSEAVWNPLSVEHWARKPSGGKCADRGEEKSGNDLTHGNVLLCTRTARGSIALVRLALRPTLLRSARYCMQSRIPALSGLLEAISAAVIMKTEMTHSAIEVQNAVSPSPDFRPALRVARVGAPVPVRARPDSGGGATRPDSMYPPQISRYKRIRG